MDGRLRAKADKHSSDIKGTVMPIRLLVGVIFLVIGTIFYLYNN